MTTLVVNPTDDIEYTSVFGVASPTADLIRVGYDYDSSGKVASQLISGMILFNLSSIPVGAVVSSAILRLVFNHNSYGVNISAATGPAWTEASTGTGWSSTGSSIFTGQPGNIRSTEVKAIVQQWVGGTLPNRGFWIADVGTPDDYFEDFYSRTGSGTLPPTLTVTYTVPPSAPGAITEPDIGFTYNASILLTNTAATDPDTSAGSLYYDWDYSPNTGGASWTNIGLSAIGTLTKPWTTSTLPTGTAYRVRVRAYDGISYGPYVTLAGDFYISHGGGWGQVPI